MARKLERKYLYEAEPAFGAIYLTIDNASPVFISFRHKVRVEVKLDKHRQSNSGYRSRSGKSDGVKAGKANDNAVVSLSTSPEFGAGRFSEPDPLNQNTPVLKDKELSYLGVIQGFEVNSSTSKRSQRSSGSRPAKPESHTNVKKSLRTISITDNMPKAKSRRQSVRSKLDTKFEVETPVKIKSQECRVLEEAGGEKMGKPVSEGFRMASSNESCDGEKDSSYMDTSDVTLGNDSSTSQPRNSVKSISKSTTCEFCLKPFKCSQDYLDHRKSPRVPHVCSVCKLVFPFHGHLLVHMKEHKLEAKEKKSQCDICGVLYKTVNSLKTHMLVHTGEYIYKCCVCGKGTSYTAAFETHMASHKNAGMYKCTCCEQFFATRADLCKHQLALMEIKCHLCGELFPNRTNRTAHYRLSHPDSILRCHICTYMFSSEKELSQHMVYHKKYRKKQCTTCGKFFSSLKKHLLTHRPLKDYDESELYSCDKCPRKFVLKSYLQEHQRRHTKEKPFKCHQCPKAFACRATLEKHIRTHSSIMPYSCDICGKRCKEKFNLKVHMRVHSTTKAFPCSLCSQAFNYKSSLEGHMRSKHSENKRNETDMDHTLTEHADHQDGRKYASLTDHDLLLHPTVPGDNKNYDQLFSGASNSDRTCVSATEIEIMSTEEYTLTPTVLHSDCDFPPKKNPQS